MTPVEHNGMSAFEAVAARRSVRRFLPQPVPDDVVETTLSAASRAPSGVNAQPWIVHIVTGEARAFGLETCPQQAWCDYGGVVHQALDIPAQHILLSGMALGYIDPMAPENKLRTERAPPSTFATRHT